MHLGSKKNKRVENMEALMEDVTKEAREEDMEEEEDMVVEEEDYLPYLTTMR
jgi:hypothetical protein